MNLDLDWTKICEGCGKCCGPMVFSPEFMERHKDRVQVKYRMLPLAHKMVMPETKDGSCVFLNRISKRCMVYNERPRTCRRFGTVPELPCPVVDPEKWKEWSDKMDVKYPGLFDDENEQ